MFHPLTFAQIIHCTGVFVCVLRYVYVAKHACLWWGAEHKDKVLIKSNSVNLFSGCNQLPQCALSSTANGCSAICYVDRYTHTSQKKWISGYKDPLFFPFLPLSPFLPYDVNRPYIPHSRSPASSSHDRHRCIFSYQTSPF